MARTFLLIDGYNLLHAAGFGRASYGPGDLERCRYRLLRALEKHLDESILKDTTVVFDSLKESHDDLPPQVSLGLRAVYSQQGRDADSEIEDLLSRHSSPRQVLVVSSDHRLHKAARRRRARCIDSDQFWDQIIIDEALPHSVPSAIPVSGGPVSKGMDSLSPDDAQLLRELMEIDLTDVRKPRREKGS